MRQILQMVTLCFIVVFNIGCTCCIADDSENMLPLASALTKLSATVESTVRYKNPPVGISDADLLILSTQHDPRILEPFSDFTVRVLNQDRHAVVLVCNKEGKYGLLEDAGCSPEIDKHLWKEQPPVPCQFSLSPSNVCNQ